MDEIENCIYCRETDSPDWRECYCVKLDLMIKSDDNACECME